ncbi:MAG: hypothetical protein ACMXYL_01110 [Candidatus Woesearchaeota archaeon]
MMVRKKFWEEWKEKTLWEERAIKHAIIAKRIILHSIPKDEIHSIYIKGSMARREMNEKSDVDTLTIVKHSGMLSKLNNLHAIHGKKYKMDIDFSGYSLWELRHNKKSNQGKADRPSPARTMHHIQTYKLIYGEALKNKTFKSTTSKKRLNEMTKVFEDKFLPNYENGLFSFSDIIKQTFWLVENEQSSLGNSPFGSWKELKDSIQDKKHIIHDAYNLRINHTKDKAIRTRFIRKLKQYIERLKD